MLRGADTTGEVNVSVLVKLEAHHEVEAYHQVGMALTFIEENPPNRRNHSHLSGADLPLVIPQTQMLDQKTYSIDTQNDSCKRFNVCNWIDKC